jgi:hypothetical protein
MAFVTDFQAWKPALRERRGTSFLKAQAADAPAVVASVRADARASVLITTVVLL